MLARYEKGDVLSIPVTEGRIAMAQIVEKLGGNVLLTVFPELLDADAVGDLASVGLDEPIFLVETMDQRIRDRVWRVTGNREVPGTSRCPSTRSGSSRPVSTGSSTSTEPWEPRSPRSRRAA